MSGEQIGLVIGLIGIAGSIGYSLGWVSGQADHAHEMAEFALATRDMEAAQKSDTLQTGSANTQEGDE